jgi:hypothetical protein
MLLAQRGCHEVVATRPGLPSHANWVAIPDRHLQQPNHDSRDHVAPNALATLAIDSTERHSANLQAAALPCLIKSVPAVEATAAAFKIDLHSQSPPTQPNLYLTTRRLRI